MDRKVDIAFLFNHPLAQVTPCRSRISRAKLPSDSFRYQAARVLCEQRPRLPRYFGPAAHGGVIVFQS